MGKWLDGEVREFFYPKQFERVRIEPDHTVTDLTPSHHGFYSPVRIGRKIRGEAPPALARKARKKKERS